MTMTPEEVFWKAVRDGYSYEAADAKRTRAELDEARLSRAECPTTTGDRR